MRLALLHGCDHADDQVAVPDQRVFSPLFASYRSPLADLLGLRFIATGVPVEQIDRRLMSDDLTFLGRTEDAYLYENPRALPRVLAPTRAVRADFGAMLKTGVWPGVDFRRTVLLDEVSTQGTSPTGDAQASARIVSYRNTRIDIAAEAPDGGGYVVLNDIWHPWWVATVDGESAPILRANVIFRAVRIPAGAHRVHFAFRPFGGLAREIASVSGSGVPVERTLHALGEQARDRGAQLGMPSPVCDEVKMTSGKAAGAAQRGHHRRCGPALGLLHFVALGQHDRVGHGGLVEAHHLVIDRLQAVAAVDEHEDAPGARPRR